MQTLPVPHNPGYPVPRQNPEGMAAFGAVLGVIVGGIAGSALSLAFKPAEAVEAVAPDADQALEAADEQAQKLLAEWAKWRRIAHALSGVTATVGSAVGAYVGAGPGQKRSAAMGAAIGTGAARALNVAFNPVNGLPGIVTGGVGAYIGARRAMQAPRMY